MTWPVHAFEFDFLPARAHQLLRMRFQRTKRVHGSLRQDQMQKRGKASSTASAFRRVTFFARTKKVTKSACRSNPNRWFSLSRGFPDAPSMARSENGWHPCRPPSGSTVDAVFLACGSQEQNRLVTLAKRLLACAHLCPNQEAAPNQLPPPRSGGGLGWDGRDDATGT